MLGSFIRKLHGSCLYNMVDASCLDGFVCQFVFLGITPHSGCRVLMVTVGMPSVYNQSSGNRTNEWPSAVEP